MSTSRVLESLTQEYAANIIKAEAFLTSRGLTTEDAATYRLGVVVDDSNPESVPYLDRLSIPYQTPAGVIDIRYRTMEEGVRPKYMSRPGAKGHIFNVGALWMDSDTIAICEGEFDAIVMDLFSGIPAVGIPGVNLWKPHFGRLFMDYDRVLVIGDGDEAGREFSKNLASKIENAIPIGMKEGMDVNGLYQNEGPDAIERLAA